jgi:hypothetical protein
VTSLAIAALAAIAAIVAVLVLIVRSRDRRPRLLSRLPKQEAVSQVDTVDDEFGPLSESERCDLIFAYAVLGDAHSLDVIEHSLDDPSESVAIAAARALARRGQNEVLARYFAARPGDRSRRIAAALELFA